MPPSVHIGRVGLHSNNFLGINWIKKYKTTWQWGYPYGHSQFNTRRITCTPRSMAKELSLWSLPIIALFLMMVQPTKSGMQAYGTWPSFLPQ
ncbi:hypothetical protein DIPPA_04008 [Diplonema papillatum]|nr:hypothetical protein DIPPA_04008 [Diplonema papillatum]